MRDMSGAIHTNANLTYADLMGADLTRANFHGADLTADEFIRLNFVGVPLIDAKLTGAIWDNTTRPDGTVTYTGL